VGLLAGVRRSCGDILGTASVVGHVARGGRFAAGRDSSDGPFCYRLVRLLLAGYCVSLTDREHGPLRLPVAGGLTSAYPYTVAAELHGAPCDIGWVTHVAECYVSG
jgi:hypothetical protein